MVSPKNHDTLTTKLHILLTLSKPKYNVCFSVGYNKEIVVIHAIFTPYVLLYWYLKALMVLQWCIKVIIYLQ